MGDPPTDEDHPCPTSVSSSNINISLGLNVPAPPLPFDTRKPASTTKKDVENENHQKKQLKLYCSCRDDYTLGEKARSFSHIKAVQPP
eukprot:scaffold1462_cov64-Cyclotella_meneghiniana.AAC.7